MNNKSSLIEKKIENVEHFNADLNVGLTSEQVESRINDGLVNKIPKHVSKSYWKIIYDNIVNFFNLFLFAIAALMIVARVPYTSFAFLVVLLLNISIQMSMLYM